MFIFIPFISCVNHRLLLTNVSKSLRIVEISLINRSKFNPLKLYKTERYIEQKLNKSLLLTQVVHHIVE